MREIVRRDPLQHFSGPRGPKIDKVREFLSVTSWGPLDSPESDFESLFRGHSAPNMAILTPDLEDLAPTEIRKKAILEIRNPDGPTG